MSTKRADVKLGFGCNNKCRHCVVGDKRGQFEPKTMETLQREMGEARARGCEEIVLTGGEPTIRKDIFSIVEMARELNFVNIQIQSNGRMFSSPEFCSAMVEAGANDFLVGFHGDVRELHEFLTDAKNSFNQTVKGIQNLRRLGQRVAINVVVTRPNFRNLPRIAHLLARLEVNQFQFAFVHPLGSALENFDSIVPRMSLVEPHVKAGLDVGRKAGITVMTEAIPYCFMQGYEDCVAEKWIPPTTIFDADRLVEDYTVQRKADGKLKGPPCQGCRYDTMCEGPWREYPEHFGWSEFCPVRG